MKTLFIYNSLTRTKEEFRPHDEGVVRMYNCGPTVYGPQHIGNLRRYVVSDTLQRVLQWAGYRVESVTNITDVGHLTDDEHDAGEDKMLKAAAKEKLDPYAIADKYTNQFFEDVRLLNVQTAPAGTATSGKTIDGWPRATESIEQMLGIVNALLQSGHAYQTHHGVYFHITKADAYGKLSGNSPVTLEAGARIDVDPDKKHPGDFVLWVKAPKEHVMKWDPAEFGFDDIPVGYPGWHIECSAMASKHLGDNIDIHTGGLDNKFPHHENEIAQSEGYLGHPFVKYWVHNELLLMEGGKMSKSLGNVMLLSDIVSKYVDDEHDQDNVAMTLRLMFLSSHYRSKMSFSEDAFLQARRNLEKIQHFYDELRNSLITWNMSPNPQLAALSRRFDEFVEKYNDAVCGDMDFPAALSHLYDFVRTYHRSNVRIEGKLQDEILSFITESFIGLTGIKLLALGIPREIELRASDIDGARAVGDYERADKIRDEIVAAGFSVETTENGTRVFRK